MIKKEIVRHSHSIKWNVSLKRVSSLSNCFIWRTQIFFSTSRTLKFSSMMNQHSWLIWQVWGSNWKNFFIKEIELENREKKYVQLFKQIIPWFNPFSTSLIDVFTFPWTMLVNFLQMKNEISSLFFKIKLPLWWRFSRDSVREKATRLFNQIY